MAGTCCRSSTLASIHDAEPVEKSEMWACPHVHDDLAVLVLANSPPHQPLLGRLQPQAFLKCQNL